MALRKELIEIILNRTRERKLSWTELSNTGFITKISPNSITIDLTNREQYLLTVTDDHGTILERTDTHQWDSEAGLLKEIYELVRRQALQIDDVLVTLKRNLQEL